jgi:hypothetical protein
MLSHVKFSMPTKHVNFSLYICCFKLKASVALSIIPSNVTEICKIKVLKVVSSEN